MEEVKKGQERSLISWVFAWIGQAVGLPSCDFAPALATVNISNWTVLSDYFAAIGFF
jgi:hypothetical protein